MNRRKILHIAPAAAVAAAIPVATSVAAVPDNGDADRLKLLNQMLEIMGRAERDGRLYLTHQGRGKANFCFDLSGSDFTIMAAFLLAGSVMIGTRTPEQIIAAIGLDRSKP